jgi:hypothetical protein
VPEKIAHRNFFFAFSGVVNRHFFNNLLSCDHTWAENGRKSEHQPLKRPKKSSDEQFLQAPRNWQKSSALVGNHESVTVIDICPYFPDISGTGSPVRSTLSP